jgi:hypothetical protein
MKNKKIIKIELQAFSTFMLDGDGHLWALTTTSESLYLQVQWIDLRDGLDTVLEWKLHFILELKPIIQPVRGHYSPSELSWFSDCNWTLSSPGFLIVTENWAILVFWL